MVSISSQRLFSLQQPAESSGCAAYLGGGYPSRFGIACTRPFFPAYAPGTVFDIATLWARLRHLE